jgi:thioredoxin-like negative regulator of GroEL
LGVASIAFVCLAMCYAFVRCCCFKAENLADESDPFDPSDIQAIPDSLDSDTQAPIVKVANQYLNEGKREEAFNTIMKLDDGNQMKETFLAKLAESYYVEGKLENALGVITKLTKDIQTKEKLIAKIAEDYLNNAHRKDYREKALSVLKELYSDTETQGTFLVKLVGYHYVGGNLKELYGDIKTKETYFANLAESYYVEGKLNEALGVIIKLTEDIQTKEKLIVKIANDYFNKGEREKAFSAIRQLRHDLKLTLLIQFAHLYFSKNNESEVIKCIEEIANYSLCKELSARGKFEIYFEIMRKYISRNLASQFFAKLAADCFSQIRGDFTHKSAQTILKEIVKKSTNDSTIQAFLKLKT